MRSRAALQPSGGCKTRRAGGVKQAARPCLGEYYWFSILRWRCCVSVLTVNTSASPLRFDGGRSGEENDLIVSFGTCFLLYLVTHLSCISSLFLHGLFLAHDAHVHHPFLDPAFCFLFLLFSSHSWGVPQDAVADHGSVWCTPQCAQGVPGPAPGPGPGPMRESST